MRGKGEGLKSSSFFNLYKKGCGIYIEIYLEAKSFLNGGIISNFSQVFDG